MRLLRESKRNTVGFDEVGYREKEKERIREIRSKQTRERENDGRAKEEVQGERNLGKEK